MILVLRLSWEDWNIKHIARHNVTPDEVEEVCHGDPYVEQGKKGRIRLIGSTREGRMLAVFLDPEVEHGVYYPVTARSASKKERREYEISKGGEKA